jgi:hypothetical protein
MMMVCVAIGGMNERQGKLKWSEKTCSNAAFYIKNPEQNLTQARNQTAEVENRQLTSWVLARAKRTTYGERISVWRQIIIPPS